MSKLSIITICYNDLDGLQFTLNSSGALSSSVEYIIIDGGSNDGTQDFLKTLSPNYNWVSESDGGLYAAMNKGLEKATGEYVIFMNSGDGFNTKQTLPKILSILDNQKPDVLYGETMYIDENNKELGLRSEITTRKLPDTLHWKMLINGMLVCHQSFLIKRSLAGPFVLNNLSADIDWMIECLKKARQCANANMLIANYLIGGISNQRHFKSLQDRFKVFVKHYGLLRTISTHISMIFRHLRHWFKPSSS